jgi:hypothetical protein
MSGRSWTAGMPLTRATAQTCRSGTRGHWLTAAVVMPVSRAISVNAPLVRNASSSLGSRRILTLYPPGGGLYKMVIFPGIGRGTVCIAVPGLQS